MHPLIRVVLAILGAVLGANLPGHGTRLLAAVVGGLAGLASGEIIFLRTALTRLRTELLDIRAALTGPSVAENERSQSALQPPERPREAPLERPPAPPLHRSGQTAEGTEGASPAFNPSDRKSRGAWTPPEAARANPLFRLLKEYFTGGNTLVRAGIVVLFFGVAFLLRYLAEHSHLPIELRLSGVASSALVLLVVGWRLRSRRAGYALALQGGAIGILYLTVFSALRLYSLLTPTAAFALLVAVSALCGALAVLQASMAVALLGVTGGFLAPFLASTGAGNHVALFSYFLVLNCAIVGIAWFRSWRLLNLAGFVFTFVLGTAWGVLQYRSQDFATTEPFLIALFGLYVAIAILYSTLQRPTLHGYIDGTIIFGTPIAAFGLQAAMLQERPFALACSALAVSSLYGSLAWLMYKRLGDLQKVLIEAFTALGVAFLTLAVPLALNGRWSAASWALEGAALIWVGCRQYRRLPRAFGALLQVAAGGALALSLTSGESLPGTLIAAMMVGIAAVYAAQSLHANRTHLADYEGRFAAALFLWGVIWWCIGGFGELGQHIDKRHLLSSTLVFATFTSLLCGELARRFQMRIALLPAFALLPVMLGFTLWATASLDHPLARGGWVSWPLAFVGFYFIAWRQDDALATPITSTLHAAALWLLAALLSWELAWAVAQIAGESGAWSAVAWAIVPAALLFLLPRAAPRIDWPVRAHHQANLQTASAGFAVYLGLWSALTNWLVSSPSAPLPYFPLLNPLDGAQGLVLFILIRFWLRLRSESPSVASSLDLRPMIVAFTLLAFIWLNAVALRTLHQWAGIPYELRAMARSSFAQTSISIFWAFLALTTMLVATRAALRVVWLTGAALLLAVVVKLFVVDLASVGTIERIVSFVGVGLLMLVLGYFSPLPPASREART